MNPAMRDFAMKEKFNFQPHIDAMRRDFLAPKLKKLRALEAEHAKTIGEIEKITKGWNVPLDEILAS